MTMNPQLLEFQTLRPNARGEPFRQLYLRLLQASTASGRRPTGQAAVLGCIWGEHRLQMRVSEYARVFTHQQLASGFNTPLSTAADTHQRAQLSFVATTATTYILLFKPKILSASHTAQSEVLNSQRGSMRLHMTFDVLQPLSATHGGTSRK